jgi:hypothetical protein
LVPDTPTYLNGGAEAWRSIAKDLAGGETVQVAVDNWNAIFNAFQYRVIGNPNATIAIKNSP